MVDILDLTIEEVKALDEVEFKSQVIATAKGAVDNSHLEYKRELEQKITDLLREIQTLDTTAQEQFDDSELEKYAATQKELEEKKSTQAILRDKHDTLSAAGAILYEVDYDVMGQLKTLIREYYRPSILDKESEIKQSLDEVNTLHEDLHDINSKQRDLTRSVQNISHQSAASTPLKKYPNGLLELNNYWN